MRFKSREPALRRKPPEREEVDFTTTCVPNPPNSIRRGMCPGSLDLMVQVASEAGQGSGMSFFDLRPPKCRRARTDMPFNPAGAGSEGAVDGDT